MLIQSVRLSLMFVKIPIGEGALTPPPPNGSPFAPKFSPPNPFARNARVRSPTGLEHTGSVRPYSKYVLCLYYWHTKAYHSHV